MQPMFKQSGPQGDWAALAPKEDFDIKSGSQKVVWPVFPTPAQLAMDIYGAVQREGVYIRHNEDGSTQVLISNMEAAKAGLKLGRTQAKRAGDEATKEAVANTLQTINELAPETAQLVRKGLLVIAFGVTQERYDQKKVNEDIRQYIHDGLVKGEIPADSIESSLPNLTGPYLARYINDDNWKAIRDSLLKQAVGNEGKPIDEEMRKTWKSASNAGQLVQALTRGGEQPLYIIGKSPSIEPVWEDLRTIYITPRPFLSVDEQGRISIAKGSAKRKSFDETIDALKCCKFKIYGSNKIVITASVKGYEEETGRVLLADERGETLYLEKIFEKCGRALRFDLILPDNQTMRMVQGVQLIPKNEIEHLSPSMELGRGTQMQSDVNSAFYYIKEAIVSKGGASFDLWNPKSRFYEWNQKNKFSADVSPIKGWDFAAQTAYDLRHCDNFESFVKTLQSLSAMTVVTEKIDMKKFSMLKDVYDQLRALEGGAKAGPDATSQRFLEQVIGELLNSRGHIKHCKVIGGVLDDIQNICKDKVPTQWFEEPKRSELLIEMYKPLNLKEREEVKGFVQGDQAK